MVIIPTLIRFNAAYVHMARREELSKKKDKLSALKESGGPGWKQENMDEKEAEKKQREMVVSVRTLEMEVERLEVQTPVLERLISTIFTPFVNDLIKELKTRAAGRHSSALAYQAFKSIIRDDGRELLLWDHVYFGRVWWDLF